MRGHTARWKRSTTVVIAVCSTRLGARTNKFRCRSHGSFSTTCRNFTISTVCPRVDAVVLRKFCTLACDSNASHAYRCQLMARSMPARIANEVVYMLTILVVIATRGVRHSQFPHQGTQGTLWVLKAHQRTLFEKRKTLFIRPPNRPKSLPFIVVPWRPTSVHHIVHTAATAEHFAGCSEPACMPRKKINMSISVQKNVGAVIYGGCLPSLSSQL